MLVSGNKYKMFGTYLNQFEIWYHFLIFLCFAITQKYTKQA